MHISDGVLTNPVCIGGYAAAIAVSGVTLKKLDMKELPKISVVTAVFFVATLINIPLGPVSIHLILNGLVGVILGFSAFLSIFLGLILQALLFGHGGLPTVGCNAILMGIPALICASVFSLVRKSDSGALKIGIGGIAGALGTILSGAILALFLTTSGEDFLGVAKMALGAHVPVMFIEGAVCAFAVSFLLKVKPEMVGGVIQA
jgi:cobalt/nickel transport system permease protein